MCKKDWSIHGYLSKYNDNGSINESVNQNLNCNKAVCCKLREIRLKQLKNIVADLNCGWLIFNRGNQDIHWQVISDC
uniref:Uncharacterized protein n=1 Tax=Arion vulgaris TaxID=1028688 RepID=A0A0B7AM55_9EUPU